MVEKRLKHKAGQSSNADPHPFLRSMRLFVRVSPVELDKIEQNRKRKGFDTVAQYVREQAIEPTQAENQRSRHKGLLSCAYQLNRIGVNINQIARHLNQGTPVDEEIKLVLMVIQEHAQELLEQAKHGGAK